MSLKILNYYVLFKLISSYLFLNLFKGIRKQKFLEFIVNKLFNLTKYLQIHKKIACVKIKLYGTLISSKYIANDKS